MDSFVDYDAVKQLVIKNFKKKLHFENIILPVHLKCLKMPSAQMSSFITVKYVKNSMWSKTPSKKKDKQLKLKINQEDKGKPRKPWKAKTN